ncbi:unnamed protein product (macronuclear) [Paramecium tetraurelia]|uniref:Serine/threonine-protein phosphatase 4 regulatory subunit 3-like central domain-containing protein n=1 Tax=Paramecium tetraurelia TaxID=5888 RepID=A0C0E6_PARTE|nr:uncharacterized protein GSPATT00006116001 [Paramecium tetraurelia]CAK64263.1 unnamed protein product [Paramecium tetraurelia]|eukprot:XP_001431661.1 hypothetical protein (macronuclear) [Paramecium tetraurelia strain d4-2]
MFFNFGRFFGFGQQPKLDNLLKKENLTIECIFNEEDILQELKGTSSSKFADFLIEHPQEYLKMINYIVEEIPDSCTEKNRCIKYPFYGSEILGSENEKLINFLFEKPSEQPSDDVRNPIEDEETEQVEQLEQNNNAQENEIIRAGLLENLLKLLDSDAIIVTTAGYFAKVVNAIIHKKGHCFWEHLKHYPDILSNLFKHSYLKHIVDIFEKLIILEENYEQSTEYMNERSALLQRLVVFLKGKQHSQLIVGNICELFVELYKKSINQFDTQNQELKSMLAQFTVTTTPLFFMNLALATQQSVVYNVLNVQFEFLNKYYLSDQQHDVVINLTQLYKPVIQLFEKALQQVDSFKIPFISADGTEITPLGDGKLLIIQFIVSLVNKPEFYSYFTAEVFSLIIDLVKQHQTNNQLHLLFERLIVALVETNDEFLHRLIFEDTNLLLFIIQNNEEKARQNKFGFQGVLTRLSNYLDCNKNKSASFQVSLQLLSTIQVDWDEYIKGLTNVNKVEQEWILGINPKQREQKFIEEIISPNIKEDTSEQNRGVQGIRKCISSDNNDVVQPKDVDPEGVEIEEDIEQDSEEKQNEDGTTGEQQQVQQVEPETLKEFEEEIVTQIIENNEGGQEINQPDVETQEQQQVETKEQDEKNEDEQIQEQDSNNQIENVPDQEVQHQEQQNEVLVAQSDQQEETQKLEQQQEPEEPQEIIQDNADLKEDEGEKEEIEEEIACSQDTLEDQTIKNEEVQQVQKIEQENENENKEEPKQIE